jgi:NAD(P)-dependent dehydrogenase (short-subunit alcohol dehydrogenase family)
MPLSIKETPSAALWGVRRFDGQSALVTGGASGIGLAVARRLAAEGAIVWIGDLEERALDSAADHPELTPLALDVTDEQSIRSAIAQLLERDGQLDVVVNCAGIVVPGSAQATSREDWQKVIDVNLTGTFLVGRHALPPMLERGSGAIVNIASDAALTGQRDQAAYCASKGGVAQLTRAAALDAAPFGVRVNCVCPCFVETPLLAAWINGSADPAKARAEATSTQPMGRIGKPEEIAGAVVYLASSEASFVTGVVLPVDGGATIP